MRIVGCYGSLFIFWSSKIAPEKKVRWRDEYCLVLKAYIFSSKFKPRKAVSNRKNCSLPKNSSILCGLSDGGRQNWSYAYVVSVASDISIAILSLVVWQEYADFCGDCTKYLCLYYVVSYDAADFRWMLAAYVSKKSRDFALWMFYCCRSVAYSHSLDCFSSFLTLLMNILDFGVKSQLLLGMVILTFKQQV